MGILFADCLSGLGCGSGNALSTLPLVCGLEAAPQPCLAELFLNWKLARQTDGPGKTGEMDGPSSADLIGRRRQNPLSHGGWQGLACGAQNQTRGVPANL